LKDRVGHKEILDLLHRPVNILNLKNMAPIQKLSKCWYLYRWKNKWGWRKKPTWAYSKIYFKTL